MLLVDAEARLISVHLIKLNGGLESDPSCMAHPAQLEQFLPETEVNVTLHKLHQSLHRFVCLVNIAHGNDKSDAAVSPVLKPKFYNSA